jgi:beta-glucosidase
LYVKGCEVSNKSIEEFEKAIEAVNNSELVIMVMGISAVFEGEEGSAIISEANGDRINIDLPGVQEDLIKAIYKTGKPIVLILNSGSSLSVNFAFENIPVIIQAWYPGEEGGRATADVIFGDYNPSGKLPITFYKSLDQLPPFEDYSMEGRTYRYFKGTPLFPFGHGLSYTKFKYSNLKLSSQKAKVGENLEVRVDLDNIGQHSGEEIVQLYIRNLNSNLNLPIRELQGFIKVKLDKAKRKNVSFTLSPKNFSHINDEGKRLVQPDKFLISVGGCQPGFGIDGEGFVEEDFELVGEKMLIQ